MLAGFIAMLPFLIIVNRKRVTRWVLAGAVAVLILAQAVFFFGHTTHIGLIAGLWLFFASFSLLEAMLPSLVSRLAPGESKGAAIGVYSSAQFLGAFAGGTLGGYLSGVFGASGVFALAATLLVAWLLLILGMREPRFLVTRELRIGAKTPAQAEKLAKKLAAVPGVAEAIVIAEEGIAYLKVDAGALDERALSKFSAAA